MNCTPEALLDFVMDIERYSTVDSKIRPVAWAHRTPELTEFACRPKLGGIRTPKVVQQIRRTSDYRIDITLSPLPYNKLAHRVSTFEASFECAPLDEGIEVTRSLTFRFHPSMKWLIEPFLRPRLTAEVADELRLAKEYLQGDG